MKFSSHRFVNKDTSEYNDQVYDRAVFDLFKHKYSFEIKPSQGTKFWRFGLAISETKSFAFNPSAGRYKNNELKYIEIDVGEKSGGSWVGDDKIAIGSYKIPEYEQKPLVTHGYVPNTSVFVHAVIDDSRKVIIDYSTGTLRNRRIFNVGNHRYFKIFCWADGIEYDIEIIIRSEGSIVEMITPNSYSITDQFEPVIEAKELATEVANLLSLLKDEKGNMFGIFGRWGRGKTFLWEEIWKNINQQKNIDSKYTRVEFHAWKYQDIPASWSYLYEVFADRYFISDKLVKYKETIHKQYLERRANCRIGASATYFFKKIYASTRSYFFQAWRKVRLNGLRLGLSPAIIFLLLLAASASWLFTPLKTKLSLGFLLTATFGFFSLLKLIYLYVIYKPKALNVIKQYGSKVSFRAHLGLQAEIQKELVFLFRSWVKNKQIDRHKIILFVDDIDRCKEDRIVEIVDALKVMLESPEISKRLIVVVALDERILKMAIEYKYRKYLEKPSSSLDKGENNKHRDEISISLTREYIDKLFIAGVRLGELSIDERIAVLDTITKNKIGVPDSIFDATLIEETSHPSQSSQATTDKIEPVEFEDLEDITNFLSTENKEISFLEHKTIKAILHRHSKGITPRSLRIYYYRFLLAKKIMQYKFLSSPSFKESWNSFQQKQLLAVLILEYSLNNNHETFDDIYRKLDDSPVHELWKFNIQDWNFEIDNRLYLNLLKIVEMVVPY